MDTNMMNGKSLPLNPSYFSIARVLKLMEIYIYISINLRTLAIEK